MTSETTEIYKSKHPACRCAVAEGKKYCSQRRGLRARIALFARGLEILARDAQLPHHGVERGAV